MIISFLVKDSWRVFLIGLGTFSIELSAMKRYYGNEVKAADDLMGLL